MMTTVPYCVQLYNYIAPYSCSIDTGQLCALPTQQLLYFCLIITDAKGSRVSTEYSNHPRLSVILSVCLFIRTM